MSLQDRIERKLREALAPTELVVENESHMHSVPSSHEGAGPVPRRETHFKVLVVSPVFEGVARVARQRKVNEVLREELASGVHALTMRTLTPAELDAGGAEGFVSPQCLGGSKKG